MVVFWSCILINSNLPVRISKRGCYHSNFEEHHNYIRKQIFKLLEASEKSFRGGFSDVKLIKYYVIKIGKELQLLIKDKALKYKGYEFTIDLDQSTWALMLQSRLLVYSQKFPRKKRNLFKTREILYQRTGLNHRNIRLQDELL